MPEDSDAKVEEKTKSKQPEAPSQETLDNISKPLSEITYDELNHAATELRRYAAGDWENLQKQLNKKEEDKKQQAINNLLKAWWPLFNQDSVDQNKVHDLSKEPEELLKYFFEQQALPNLLNEGDLREKTKIAQKKEQSLPAGIKHIYLEYAGKDKNPTYKVTPRAKSQNVKDMVDHMVLQRGWNGIKISGTWGIGQAKALAQRAFQLNVGCNLDNANVQSHLKTVRGGPSFQVPSLGGIAREKRQIPEIEDWKKIHNIAKEVRAKKGSFNRYYADVFHKLGKQKNNNGKHYGQRLQTKAVNAWNEQQCQQLLAQLAEQGRGQDCQTAKKLIKQEHPNYNLENVIKDKHIEEGINAVDKQIKKLDNKEEREKANQESKDLSQKADELENTNKEYEEQIKEYQNEIKESPESVDEIKPKINSLQKEIDNNKNKINELREKSQEKMNEIDNKIKTLQKDKEALQKLKGEEPEAKEIAKLSP